MARIKDDAAILKKKLRSAQTMLAVERRRTAAADLLVEKIVERLEREDCPDGIKSEIAGIIKEACEAEDSAAVGEKGDEGSGEDGASAPAGRPGQAAQGDPQ